MSEIKAYCPICNGQVKCDPEAIPLIVESDSIVGCGGKIYSSRKLKIKIG